MNDAEYQASNSAFLANALPAYQAGATGKGIKVAVIDTGINPNLPEFIGKIDPASQDVASNRGLVDTHGHGTEVSGIIAANRDGQYMQGVAYNAKIISLNAMDPAGCKPGNDCLLDTAIPEAIDLARTGGAKIINMSFGDEEGMTPDIWPAIQRAVDAGIIIIMGAGNKALSDPNSFALKNIQNNGASGLFIIAGSIDGNGTISSFSDRAGTTIAANSYLAALGRLNATIDQFGAHVNVSGTSFATPTIAGAAALLASAFPHLSGAEIVNLLLSTADEAGAPGTDAIYGRGILNIGRAFQPQGTTTVAGTSQALSLTDNGASSGPMGDASARAGPGAVILDGYSRAYVLDLAKTLRMQAQERPLQQGIGSQNYRTERAAAGPVSVNITMRYNALGEPHVETAPLSLGYDESLKAKAVAGTAISRISPATALALGLSQSGRALQQELTGKSDGAFLVASNPFNRTGFYADPKASIGLRHQLGRVALIATSERGKAFAPGLDPRGERPAYKLSSIAIEAATGAIGLSVGLSRLREEDTILGSRFASTLAGQGSRSTFVDATANVRLGWGWNAAGSYRRGWTALAAGGLADGGRLQSEAFAVDLYKPDIFKSGDRLSFRVTQPLRVTRGGFNLTVPVSYDYDTRSVEYGRRFLSLSPKGQELDYEIAYTLGLLGGYFDFNAFFRTDPGNIESMKRDIGAAVRFTLR